MILGDVGPIRVHADVRGLDVQDYSVALDAFIERITIGAAVRSVWQFGSWRTPGVSDMDVLVVTADGAWRHIRELSASAIGAKDVSRYLFTHEAVVIPESLLGELSYVHTVKSARRVCGFTPVMITDMAHPVICLIRHIVWSSFMWHSLAGTCNRQVGLRGVLLLLNNCMMSAQMGRALAGVEDSHASVLSQSVRERLLRTNPGTMEVVCREAYREVIRSLAEADWQVHDWAVRQGWTGTPDSVREIQIGRHIVAQFLPERSCLKKLTQEDELTSSGAPTNSHVLRLVLPSVYYTVLSAIAPCFKLCAPQVFRIFNVKQEVHISPEFLKAREAYGSAIQRIVEQARRERVPNQFPSPYPTPFCLVYSPLWHRIERAGVLQWGSLS